MPGPNKKARKPENTDSESSSDGEESDSGTYHGQKVGKMRCCSNLMPARALISGDPGNI